MITARQADDPRVGRQDAAAGSNHVPSRDLGLRGVAARPTLSWVRHDGIEINQVDKAVSEAVGAPVITMPP